VIKVSVFLTRKGFRTCWGGRLRSYEGNHTSPWEYFERRELFHQRAARERTGEGREENGE